MPPDHAIRERRHLASDPLVQTAVKEVPRDSAAAFCRTAQCPSDQGRAANGTAQIGCAWPCVAGRCRSGVETVEEIAAGHKCSVRHVNMTISMAFIAPGLVKAAVEGRLPRGIGIANLRDAPAEWSRQYERLGLT